MQIRLPIQFQNLSTSIGATWCVIREAAALPHFQVPLLELSIIDRQNIKILFQSKGVEGQLYPVALSRDDDPGAVGVVGVAVRKARALDGAIGTLHQAPAGLAWERKCKEKAY